MDPDVDLDIERGDRLRLWRRRGRFRSDGSRRIRRGCRTIARSLDPCRQDELRCGECDDAFRLFFIERRSENPFDPSHPVALDTQACFGRSARHRDRLGAQAIGRPAELESVKGTDARRIQTRALVHLDHDRGAVRWRGICGRRETHRSRRRHHPPHETRTRHLYLRGYLARRDGQFVSPTSSRMVRWWTPFGYEDK